jgi:hypothetical protein
MNMLAMGSHFSKFKTLLKRSCLDLWKGHAESILLTFQLRDQCCVAKRTHPILELLKNCSIRIT